jgi:CBS domain-containing protein
MPLREICNREVVFIGRESSIRDAVGLMRTYHVGSVVVVDEDQGRRLPVGLLTDRDVVIELLAKDVELDKVSVGDVMSGEILTAGEEDDILETIQLMRSGGIRRLPVVDKDGGLAGIVTVDDLIDLIAEQLTDLARLIVNEQGRERRARV